MYQGGSSHKLNSIFYVDNLFVICLQERWAGSSYKLNGIF